MPPPDSAATARAASADPFDATGKQLAVVTGATAGIGEATVRIFAERGIPVVAVARRRDRLGELEAELTARGGAVAGVCGDVTLPDSLRAPVAIAGERWGRPPTTFVLCAGHGLPGTVLTSDEARWEELVQANFLAIARQLRECARVLLSEPNSGSVARDIVVIGSTVGRHPSPKNPVYGSTKAAVHSLTESLRQELAPAGVRVTLVEPGFVKTDFQRTAGYDLDWFAAVERDMGPLLSPEDVAGAIDFVVRQPPHVHLDDIRIRPTRQQL